MRAALALVALVIAAVLFVPASVITGRERARVDAELRERAARSAHLAAVLLRRDVSRGRALLGAIAGSRAVQEAAADRSPSAVLTAVQPFRREFDRFHLVVDDDAGRPLAWSSPFAAYGLGMSAGRPADAAAAPAAPQVGLVAGDLALLVERPIEAEDGRVVGRARAAIVTGRLFVREVATELETPIAIYDREKPVHHAFAADPPPPPAVRPPPREPGDPLPEPAFAQALVAGQPHVVAFLPLEVLPGELWIAAGVSREEADAALARFSWMAWGSSVGALAVVIGGLAAFVAVSRRQETLVRQRDQERRRSEGLSDRLEQLAAVVHDIKAPLGGMQLRCEQLLEDEPPPAMAAALASVVDSCDRLNLYLVNVLTAAQAAERPIAPRREVVLVGGLVEDVAERLRPLAQRRRIDLRTEVARDVPPLQGDPVLLERALLNLASNAVSATPPGGSVLLFARRADGGVELGARDTGPGFRNFSPDEAFARGRPVVKDASYRTGTGLGLFIVARIAEAHGGRAVARNREAGGAEVSFFVP